MKFKKLTAAAVSLAMLANCCLTSVAASDKQKQYDYVAIGDSIAAGYGLEGKLTDDRSVILNKELIDDPVKSAYPSLFGTYLEKLGEEKGYKTTAVNISSVAYTAGDIANTIRDKNYKSKTATYVFDTVGVDSDVLLSYHDLFNEYIANAELVSINLGANDVCAAIAEPMIDSDNPLFKAAVQAMMLTVVGNDAETVISGAYSALKSAGREITSKDITEFVDYFAGLPKNTDKLLDTMAANVTNTIEAVREVNPDADIVIVNMYNPFATPKDMQVKDISEILSDVYKVVAEQAAANGIPLPALDEQDMKKLTDALGNMGELVSDGLDVGAVLDAIENIDQLIPDSVDTTDLKNILEELKQAIPEDMTGADLKGLISFVAMMIPEDLTGAQFKELIGQISPMLADDDNNPVIKEVLDLIVASTDDDDDLSWLKPLVAEIAEIIPEQLEFNSIRSAINLVQTLLPDQLDLTSLKQTVKEAMDSISGIDPASIEEALQTFLVLVGSIEEIIPDSINTTELKNIVAQINDAIPEGMTGQDLSGIVQLLGMMLPDDLTGAQFKQMLGLILPPEGDTAQTVLAVVNDLVADDADMSWLKPALTELSQNIPAELQVDDIKAVLDLVRQLVPDEIDLTGLKEDIKKVKGFINGVAENLDFEQLISDLSPYIINELGKALDPYVIKLNERLEDVAIKTGSYYVDIYSITPDMDLDPHPSAQGHIEIADKLWADLEAVIAAKMTDEEAPEEETPKEKKADKKTDEKPAPTPADSGSGTTGNPKTGAEAGLAVMLISLGAAVVLRKKKAQDK